MEIIEIIIAGAKAYLEREKAKQDKAQAMRIIDDINSSVLANQQAIRNALQDMELDELTRLYLGKVENFEEYKPSSEFKYLPNDIGSVTNDIFASLMHFYEQESDVGRVRKIVRLALLVMHLRALVYSELKNTPNDNRDEHLLKQFKKLKNCYLWLIDNQHNHYWLPRWEEWRYCEEHPTTDNLCINIPDEHDRWGDPTYCCQDQYNAYKLERTLLSQDVEQRNKVDESITHLESAQLLMCSVAQKNQ